MLCACLSKQAIDQGKVEFAFDGFNQFRPAAASLGQIGCM